MKYLKNQKGMSLIELLIIISVLSVIGMAVMPKYETAFKNRSEFIINNFNSTDTLIVD